VPVLPLVVSLLWSIRAHPAGLDRGHLSLVGTLAAEQVADTLVVDFEVRDTEQERAFRVLDMSVGTAR
jgi:hypothetical protein